MKLAKNEYYKCTRPDLTSFHDAKTRWDEGSEVRLPAITHPKLCTHDVLHASRTPLDALKYGKIPCAMSLVRGIPVVEDYDKSGFFRLEVIRNIPVSEYDGLFGFRYSEVVNPVDPCDVDIRTVTKKDKQLLREWASVRDFVRASVRDSVWSPVWSFVWDSVADSVWASVRDFVWDSVRDSVWSPVWSSVTDSVWAYTGSLFPNVKDWKYAPKSDGYPYACAVKLWKRGLIPVQSGEKWKLYHPVRGKLAVLMYEEAR